MKGNFVQLKKFLQTRYPELYDQDRVIGGIQPPTAMGELVGKICSMIWVIGIGLQLGGGYLFNTLHMPEPWWYIKMKENTMAVFVGLFMINNVGAGLMQTGAFEVFLNGVKVYSKLETGQMPTGQIIVEAFAKHGLQ